MSDSEPPVSLSHGYSGPTREIQDKLPISKALITLANSLLHQHSHIPRKAIIQSTTWIREFERCSQYKLVTDGWGEGGHENEKGMTEVIPLFIGLSNKGMVRLRKKEEQIWGVVVGEMEKISSIYQI